MLIYRNKLDIYRIGAEEGYLDENGKWFYGNTEQVIPIKCSLQPYVSGNQERELPDGVSATDARYVFTKTKILQSDDRTGIKADETVVEGIRYQCFRVKDYNMYGLPTDHYECIFVRKDKL